MKHAFLDNTLSQINASNCLKKLEVLCEYKVFDKKPKQCPNCDSRDLDGLEIIGIKEGAIFWECENCMFKFLKYSVQKTLKYFKEAEGTWYTPSDWQKKERN